MDTKRAGKRRYTARQINIHFKDQSMLKSNRWSERHVRVYLRSVRGVLTPIIRGYSEPCWLREA